MEQKKTGAIKYQGLLFAAFIIAAFLSLPAISEINDYRFYIYLPDYSIGYCAKLLVGGVLALFKDSFTKEWLFGYMRVVVAVVSMFFALFLGKWIAASPKELRMPYFVLALFFATSPFAFNIFSSLIGLHDIYWYFFIVLALMCIKNKVLMWLVPLLSVLCVANHIAYLLILFPVLFIILLHLAVYSERKGVYKVLFAAMLLLTAGASVYVLFFERQTLNMTLPEMLSYTKAKINTDISSTGFEYTIFGYVEGVNLDALPEGQYFGSSIIATLRTLMNVAMNGVTLKRVVEIFFAILPFTASTAYIWAYALHRAKKLSERMIYFFCLLTFLALPILWLVSTDSQRWAALFCISQLMLLVFLLKEKDEYVCAAFNKIAAAVKEYPIVAAGAACLLYLIP